MTYRKEAAIRVAAFCAAFVVSVIVAVVAASLIALVSNKASEHTRGLLIAWSFMVAFLVACAWAVYYTDQRLNREFKNNP